jgi:hypothetical protein
MRAAFSRGERWRCALGQVRPGFGAGTKWTWDHGGSRAALTPALSQSTGRGWTNAGESKGRGRESNPAGKREKVAGSATLFRRLLNHQRTKDTKHGKSLWKPPNLGALGALVVRDPDSDKSGHGTGHELGLGAGDRDVPSPRPSPRILGEGERAGRDTGTGTGHSDWDGTLGLGQGTGTPHPRNLEREWARRC